MRLTVSQFPDQGLPSGESQNPNHEATRELPQGFLWIWLLLVSIMSAMFLTGFASNRRQPKYPLVSKCLNKMQYIHTMKYNSGRRNHTIDKIQHFNPQRQSWVKEAGLKKFHTVWFCLYGTLKDKTIVMDGLPSGSVVKNLPAMQETQVQSLGQEDLLEEGTATHSSVLEWRIPWTEEPGGLQSVGLQRVGYKWSDWAHLVMENW